MNTKKLLIVMGICIFIIPICGLLLPLIDLFVPNASADIEKLADQIISDLNP